MANIMITRQCNLACSYCFANEFVNNGYSEITTEQFRNICDFILSDGTEERIGLIGGEPTLHHQFADLIRILDKDTRVKRVIVYTNGLLMSQFAELMVNPKFELLINCNDFSQNANNDRLFNKSMNVMVDILGEKITPGCNFYSPEFDFSYMIGIVKKYNFKKLRVSVSIPSKFQSNYSPLDYFSRIKPGLLAFFTELKKAGTVPFFDCNVPPPCLVDLNVIKEFESWGNDNPFLAIGTKHTSCAPVIDIMPDNTAVRCFGLSEYTKTNITDFASISDLRGYYMRTVDSYAVNTVYDQMCRKCYKYKAVKCSGGCLIYKADRIMRKRERDRTIL